MAIVIAILATYQHGDPVTKAARAQNQSVMKSDTLHDSSIPVGTVSRNGERCALCEKLVYKDFGEHVQFTNQL